jgi:hypothetical protein
MSLQSAYGAPVVSFSTSEVDTGMTWTDGKKVYKKVIDLGSLPNAVLKTVAHGVTGLDTIISLVGHAKTTGTFSTDIQFVQTGGLDGIGLARNGANLEIQPGTQDRSTLSGFAIMLYTKT